MPMPPSAGAESRRLLIEPLLAGGRLRWLSRAVRAGLWHGCTIVAGWKRLADEGCFGGHFGDGPQMGTIFWGWSPFALGDGPHLGTV